MIGNRYDIISMLSIEFLLIVFNIVSYYDSSCMINNLILIILAIVYVLSGVFASVPIHMFKLLMRKFCLVVQDISLMLVWLVPKTQF